MWGLAAQRFSFRGGLLDPVRPEASFAQSVAAKTPNLSVWQPLWGRVFVWVWTRLGFVPPVTGGSAAEARMVAVQEEDLFPPCLDCERINRLYRWPELFPGCSSLLYLDLTCSAIIFNEDFVVTAGTELFLGAGESGRGLGCFTLFFSDLLEGVNPLITFPFGITTGISCATAAAAGDLFALPA